MKHLEKDLGKDGAKAMDQMDLMSGNTEFVARWVCQEDAKGSSCKNGTTVKQYLHGNNKIEIVGLDGGHFYEISVAALVENCWDENGFWADSFTVILIIFGLAFRHNFDKVIQNGFPIYN